jgi:hypothetical protein
MYAPELLHLLHLTPDSYESPTPTLYNRKRALGHTLYLVIKSPRFAK